jgi:hypothetical protein
VYWSARRSVIISKFSVGATRYRRYIMKKMPIVAATLIGAVMLCATPLSIRWSQENVLSLSQDSACARVGRPLTPVSVAGVHRRAVRRCAAGVTCPHY